MPNSISMYNTTLRSPYKIGKAQLLFAHNTINLSIPAINDCSTLIHRASQSSNTTPLNKTTYIKHFKNYAPIKSAQKRANQRASSLLVDYSKSVSLEPIYSVCIKTVSSNHERQYKVNRMLSRFLNKVRASTTSCNSKLLRLPKNHIMTRYTSPVFENQLIKTKIIVPQYLSYRSKLSRLFSGKHYIHNQSTTMQNDADIVDADSQKEQKGRIVLNIPLVAC